MSGYNPERVRFSLRLGALLDKLEYPKRGRARVLSEEFGVSQKGARKWLIGESIPHRDTIVKMAEKWSVSGEALEYGSGLSLLLNDHTILGNKGRVPVIASVSAGKGKEVFDPYEPGVADEWLYCPSPHSSSTFATPVDGNSMTCDGPESYPHGSIIFCDPELVGDVTVGDKVIARIISTDDRTFKVLDSSDGNPVLLPLNPSQAYKPITEDFEILAVVIGNYIPTKRGL